MNLKHAVYATFLLFLFMLVFVPSTSAEIIVNTYATTNDFSIYSSDIKACACTAPTDFFTIKNTGSYTSTFYIEGDDPKVRFGESSFELGPGDSRNVYTYLPISCDPMNKNLKITVKNNLGVQKTFDKRIIQNKCQNLEMWLSKSEENISSCGATTFKIFVKNIGTFDEEYALSSNWDISTTYSSDSFTLKPQETAQIVAKTTFDCSISGQKDIVFRAEAMKNKLKADIKAKINIAEDYKYISQINNIDSSAVNAAVCNRVWSTKIPITIKNAGIANDFTLKYERLPGFAKKQTEHLSLGRGESGTIYIDIDTHDFRGKAKNYNVDISIIPKFGEITKKKLILQLNDCYEHKLVAESDSTEKKPHEVCAGYPYDYTFEVFNYGTKAEEIIFTLEGAPNTFKLTTKSMKLDPGASNKGFLKVTGPETNEIYNARIIATLKNGIEAKDNLWIKSYDSKACHAITLKDKYKINYDDKDILLELSQKGLIGGEYKVELEDNAIASLDKDSVNITGNEALKIDIKSKDKEQGVYESLLKLKHVESGTEYQEKFDIVLKDKSWIVKAYEYFNSNTCKKLSLYQILVIIILIALIIYFSIAGPHYPYNFWNRALKKMPVLIALIVLFIIIAGLVVIFAGPPKNTNQVYNLKTNYTELHFEWIQDEPYTLDVSQFFSDPDKDKLSFKVSPIRNVDTKVSAGKVVLHPDKGWAGERTFTVTALDSRGERTVSPEMSLKVREKPKISLIEWHGIYCWYGNLAILLLMFIIIFFIVIVKQRVRKRSK